jgi:hypothetical protein
LHALGDCSWQGKKTFGPVATEGLSSRPIA